MRWLGLGGIVQGLLWSAFFLLSVAGLGLVLEIIWRREDMTVRDRLKGFFFWPFLLAGNALAGLALVACFQAAGVTGLIDVTDWPLWLRLITFVVAADFLFYVYHRLQHRFLWRFHSVHHSIERLSSINSYHHWSEPAWSALLQTAPMIALGLKPGPGTFLLMLVVQAQPFLIHSATRLHLGPLGKLLIDGRFHRIHHSVEARHFDKNFGALLPVWDVVFRTAYWPRGEWPAVGLEGKREPHNIGQWLGLDRLGPRHDGRGKYRSVQSADNDARIA